MEEIDNKKPIIRTADEFLDIEDNSRQANMIRDAYNNMDCMYGKYTSNYLKLWEQIFCAIIATIVIGVFMGLFLFMMINYPTIGLCIGLSFGVALLSVFWFYIMITLFSNLLNVYFYKHNGKLVTIHFRRFPKYFSICLEKDKHCVYNFRKKRWEEKTIHPDSYMGTYLLFPYLFSDNLQKTEKDCQVINKIKNKRNNQTIITSKKFYIKKSRYNNRHYTTFNFKDGNLKSIDLFISFHHIDTTWHKKHHYLRIDEMNTIHCTNVSKSFIDFCNEQGIEPPAECEHLHYEKSYNK